MSGGLRISCFDACALQEDDLAAAGVVAHRVGFQSTSSVWRTTRGFDMAVPSFINFNPRPPCGGRPLLYLRQPAQKNFNPRPPCGGRRPALMRPAIKEVFQSTSSVWRTTWVTKAAQANNRNFNPRPPCGGRQRSRKGRAPAAHFNPRPPCGGRPYAPPCRAGHV